MNTFKVINPFNKAIVGEVKYDSLETLKELESNLSLMKKEVKNLTSFERSEILERASKLLLKNKEEMANLITQEMGKTIGDSLVEIDRSVNTLLASSHAARDIRGETLDSDSYAPKRERFGMVKKEPIGVVLAITPFNFPINLSVHKIGPSFAAGNVTIFKPGPQNYFSAKKLVEILYEAGMPEASLKLIIPDIPELNYLISSNEVQCISFTGGVVAADSISKNAGRKKLLFELGGNDPLIVMPDADLSKAVDTAINQRFGTGGQRCTASKRLFVHHDVYTKFKTLLLQKTKSLSVGDPMDKDTFVGPLVNEAAAIKVETRINKAVEEGATLLFGGKREGAIIYPTILEDVKLTSEVICDETFGPVIPLIKFSDLDSVTKIINSTPFGLQAGVFTQDISTIKKLFDEINVGALAVNDGPGFRAEHFPFGGVKSSGLGREGIRYAMEEMMVLKTLIF